MKCRLELNLGYEDAEAYLLSHGHTRSGYDIIWEQQFNSPALQIQETILPINHNSIPLAISPPPPSIVENNNDDMSVDIAELQKHPF